ncbi:MAG: right-handed parallel beta-helix repeat-containing protein [Planctomycetota bacterium]|jgi:hypothetical protein
MLRVIILLSLFSIFPVAALSEVIDVPGDYSTIQEAIDAAMDGDTIVVSPCTYVENVHFKDKDKIRLMSRNGPYVTVIDGNQNGSVVTIPSNSSHAVVQGFTIRNGNGYWESKVRYGGGIYCEGSAALISENIIRGNQAGDVWGRGGGIYSNGSYIRIINNLFIDNRTDGTVGGDGGGVYLKGYNPVLTNNLFVNNRATARGGGIFSFVSVYDVKVSNNTLYMNSSKDGGGICCLLSDMICTNTILWENEAVNGKEVFVSGIYSDPGHLAIDYSDVQGGQASILVDSFGTLEWGDGMIDADPMFVDPAGFDYHLQQDPWQPGVVNSCVDSGSNLSFNLGMHVCWTSTGKDPDSGLADMGYHYGPFTLPGLVTDGYALSAASGGNVVFSLRAGRLHQKRDYIILGGMSGFEPGFALPGGHVTLPVNWDVLTDQILPLINTPVFSNFLSKLDIHGAAEAELATGPLDPAFVGLVMHYAYALNMPFDYASNPVQVEIVQ